MFFIPHKFILFRISIFLYTAFLLISCGGGSDNNSNTIENTNNTVVVDNQAVVDLDKITLSAVNVEQTVCVVIYESIKEIDNTAGDIVIAEKTLEKGLYNNESIHLNREISDNETLYVQLHENACAGDNGIIETSSVVIPQEGTSFISFIVSWSTEPYVNADDQIAKNLYKINVNSVVSETSSWIVVHRYDFQASNKLGELVGSQLVEEGRSSNVSLLLNIGIKKGEEFVVALYRNGIVTEFESFESTEDTLIDNTISPKFSVDIPSSFGVSKCNECIHFTITGLGYSAYLWSGDALAQNKIISQVGVSGDETIRFTVGERYEIINTHTSLHPLLIYGDGFTYLLSQGGIQGIFEDDSDVNWTEENGVMTFTVTQELADAMRKYLCINHNAMTGDIVIAD